MRDMTRLDRPLLTAVALLVALAASALAEPDTKALNDATVKITAVSPERSPETGSGVIVCVNGDMAYIITAKHVVDGPPDKPFSPKCRYTIEFHGNQAKAFRDLRRNLTIKTAMSKDLALISIPLDGRTLVTLPLNSSDNVQQGQEVFTTGHQVNLDEQWFFRSGRVNKIGEFIKYSAGIDGGFSGGPVVDDSGRLIGMNTAVHTGSKVGMAIPVKEITRTVGSWVGDVCLATDPGPSPVTGGGTASAGLAFDDAAGEFMEMWSNGSTDRSRYLELTRSMAADLDDDLDAEDERALSGYVRQLEQASGPDAAGTAVEEIGWWLLEYDGDVADPVMPPNQDGTIIGRWFLVTMRDTEGMQLDAPMISGVMDITHNGGATFILAFELDLQIMSVAAVVNASLQGNMLMGTVVQSNNMFVPVGEVYQSTASLDGGLLYLQEPDFTLTVWRR